MDRDMKENLVTADQMALAQSLALMDQEQLELGRTDGSMRNTRIIEIQMGENMGSKIVTEATLRGTICEVRLL
jgi:hypothetical protein